MAIDYQRTPRWLLDNFWFAWPGFLTVFLAVIAFLAAPRRWHAPLAIIPLGLLPVLGLTPFDFQNYSTVADRYMYLPMLGVSLAAAYAMDRAGPRLIPWTLAGLVLVLLAARSFDQTKVWHNTESLANQQFTLDPASATGHKILGSWLSLQGRDQEAETHLKLAIDVLTDDPAADGVPWYNYGNLLIAEHRYPEAIAQFELAIPRLNGAGLAQAYINLGVALIRTGEVDRAKEAFGNALKIQPENRAARENLNILEGK
jgi:tetratricopeptide (TPR) repeat protein